MNSASLHANDTFILTPILMVSLIGHISVPFLGTMLYI
jgi:hypothetical protein